MFLYICLVLLPATALASCDRDVQDDFFKAIDGNNDGEDHLSEVDAFYKALNADNDTCLTLKEVKERIPTVAPKLKDHETPLYATFDMDKDGCITKGDIDCGYLIMDTDKNGAISREEFNTAFGIFCFQPHIISSLIKSLCIINGLIGSVG